MRQGIDGSLLGTAVMDGRAHEHVFRIRLGVLDLNVEVPVVIENAGVDQLELHSPPSRDNRHFPSISRS